MDHFARQVDTQIRTTGRLDLAFISKLMRQAWDSTRGEIDTESSTQLYRALSSSLGRMDADARELAVGFISAYQQDNRISGSQQVHVLAPELYRQCTYCYGSGQTSCSSCGGVGGRSESRIEYDYDNNPVYREEWISCFCNGGYASCGVCGGSGSVAR